MTSLAISSTGDNEDEPQGETVGEFHEVDRMESIQEARKAKSKSQACSNIQATNHTVKVEKVWAICKSELWLMFVIRNPS